MKKRISIVLVFTVTLCIAIPAYTGSVSAASYNVRIILNGQRYYYPLGYGQPFISNEGRTLVPLRGVAEAYGCRVDWNQDRYGSWQAVVRYNGHYAFVHPNRKTIYTDSGKKYMDTYARIINDRTYLPIRYVMEAMGANVSWDNENRLVIISNPSMYTDPLNLLKVSLVRNGKYDSSTGVYSYADVMSRDRRMVSILEYDTRQDKVRVYIDLIDENNTGYVCIFVDVDESYQASGYYISGVKFPDGEYWTWSGHLNKMNYGNTGSYTIEQSSNVDVNRYYSSLINVNTTLTESSVIALNKYCRTFNLGITSADFGFAK